MVDAIHWATAPAADDSTGDCMFQAIISPAEYQPIPAAFRWSHGHLPSGILMGEVVAVGHVLGPRLRDITDPAVHPDGSQALRISLFVDELQGKGLGGGEGGAVRAVGGGR